jgi:hypothetical protein
MTLPIEDWEFPSLRWVLLPFGQFELTRALALVFPLSEARRKARGIVRPLQRLDEETGTFGIGPGAPGWIAEPEGLSLIAQLSPRHAQRADAHIHARFLDQIHFARRGSPEERAAIAGRTDTELLTEFLTRWERLKAAAAERVRHRPERPPQN